MGKAAWECLGDKITSGVVITKHGQNEGPIGPIAVRVAGHPVPDADTFSATAGALTLTDGLTVQDTVLFLLSGGGSALFEAPWSLRRSSRT